MLNNLKIATRNSIIYGLGNLFIKFIGLILFPIYTKHLSISEYGILGILEVSTQILVAIFGCALYSGFFRYYYDKEFSRKQKSMFFTLLLFLLFSVLIMFIIFIPISSSLSNLLFDSPEYSYLLTLMIISSGIQIINNIPSTLIRLLEKPVLFSTANIIRLIITLILTIYFIVPLGRGLEGIYEAQIIGQISYFIFLMRFTLRNIEFKFNKKGLRTILIFSLPLALSAVSVVAITIIDRYALKFLTELKDVGLYSAAYKISNVIAFIISASQLAITPIIYKKINDPDNKRFYSKIMTYSTYVVIIMVCGLSVFGKEVVKVLAQHIDYWDAFKLIPILSFSILFGMLRYTATTGLNIAKRTQVLAIITTTTVILNLLLNILLIPYFRATGAAIASLVTQVLYFISVYYFSQKYYYIPYEVGKIIKMITIGLLIILIAIPVNDLNLLYRLIIKTVLIFSYPFLLYFFNFYEKVELDRIKGAWNKWKNLKNLKKNISDIKIE